MNIALQPKAFDTSAIEIRLAGADDVPALVELLGTFFAESQWPQWLSYDPEKARATLTRVIPHWHPHIIALEGGEIVGLVSYHLDRQFTEPIAVMDETYIAPRFRKTDLGRKLVALALYLAKHDGAPIFNFPLASGMREHQAYVNLLKKYGGEVCGVLVRVDLSTLFEGGG